jgi:thiol-disulfide isomerase/thioredoxin
MSGKVWKGISIASTQVIAAVLLWSLLAMTCAAGTLEPVAGGYTPGDFSLVDLQGNAHALSDSRGKVVLVNFWASWCPPCIREMPGMQRLQQVLAEQPFAILAVNVGEKKYKVWKFVKLVNFNLPVLLDEHSETFADWGISVLPTSLLLDSRGNVRCRVQGDLPWDSEEVVSLIEQLINEGEDPQRE